MITSETFQLILLKDGSFSLLDRISGKEYTPDPWDEGPGTLTISQNNEGRKTTQSLDLSMADKIQREVNGQTIKISFIWNQGIDLLISLALLEDSLTIAIENLVLPDDTRLVNLVYPNRFASLKTGENGYLIVPARCGYIIPSHHYTRIGGEFWRMDDAYTQTNPNGITNTYFPLLEHDASFNPYLIRQIDPDNPDPVKRAKDNDRWSRTCSSLIIDFAKANNESKEYRDLGENAHFIDIMGVSSGYECYDTTNHKHMEPISRKQDKDLRNKMFSYLHDELNLVTWQEHGSATELKTMDSFHGTAETHVAFEEIGVQIPLAALVAHDLVVLTQHPGWNYRHARGQFYARVLQNILQGNPPIHCIQAWEFEGRKKDIASFHKVIARIHRQVGLSKLIDHQFLPGPSIFNTGTFLIQKTSFDDGSSIYANFGMNPYQSDDVNLGPYGFEARLGSGEVLKGSVISNLHII